MVTSIRPGVTIVPALWAGGVAWLAALMTIPVPLQERILLLAPLVIVPALLARLPARPVTSAITTGDLAGWPLLIAALPLVGAAVIARGPVAALLTLPWLLTSAILASAAVIDGVRGLPGIMVIRRASDLTTDAALVALAVGACALTADRAGVAFLRFEDVIRTLTAVQFHFAAFGLVGIAALTAGARPGWFTWLAAVGLVGGTAVTALGFMLQSVPLNWVGAVVVGASGVLEASLIGRIMGRPRGPMALVAWSGTAALTTGMALAIAWATAVVVSPGAIGIDQMVRTHGILNAFAVTVLVLTAACWSRSAVDR